MSKRVGPLFLLPAVGLYLLTTVVPLIQVGRLSFFETNYIATEWVGLANYRELLTDAAWWKALVVTARFSMLLVPLQTFVPLLMALLLTTMGKKWQTYARVVFYVPTFVSGLVMSSVWRWMWHSEYGIVNEVLKLVGLPAVYWFAGTWSSTVAITVILLLTTMGGHLVIYLAVMCGISKELYESAAVDGATPGQVRRHIIVPMVMPTVLIVLLTATVGALQMWYLPYMLTDGGPAGATTTLMFLLFREGVAMARYGYANAQAMVLMLMVVAVGGVTQWLRRRMR